MTDGDSKIGKSVYVVPDKGDLRKSRHVASRVTATATDNLTKPHFQEATHLPIATSEKLTIANFPTTPTMVAAEARGRWVVTLQDMPSNIPAAVRLRKFLKAARRAYSLKCLSITEMKVADGATNQSGACACARAAEENDGNTHNTKTKETL